MKITQDYTGTEEVDIVEVISARYVGNFSIDVIFSDGKKNIIDFKSFLEKSSHPSITQYLNEDFFADFKINRGNLNWNDYDLIFPLEDLYEGNIK